MLWNFISTWILNHKFIFFHWCLNIIEQIVLVSYTQTDLEKKRYFSVRCFYDKMNTGSLLYNNLCI